MTTPVREYILARICALLQAATPAGAAVYRSLESALVRAAVPAVAVIYRGTDAVEHCGDADLHRMQLDVVHVVRGDPWDTLAAQLDGAAHAALLSDAPLRELGAELVRLGDTPEATQADLTAGTLAVHYQVSYFTARRDICAPP